MSTIELERGYAPQLEGSTAVRDLRRMCGAYHGRRGRFAYDAFAWLTRTCFDGRLPIPLLQWALTAWGRCLGFTVSRTGRGPTPAPAALPVITLHPGIWIRAAYHDEQMWLQPRGWAAKITPGQRYTLDVVLHELVHVDVNYLRGGQENASNWHSSHDNPLWCAAIEAVADRLVGTMLELPPFTARPSVRVKVDGKLRRQAPDGAISIKALSMWPHSLRDPQYYRDRSVPFRIED